MSVSHISLKFYSNGPLFDKVAEQPPYVWCPCMKLNWMLLLGGKTSETVHLKLKRESTNESQCAIWQKHAAGKNKSQYTVQSSQLSAAESFRGHVCRLPENILPNVKTISNYCGYELRFRMCGSQQVYAIAWLQTGSIYDFNEVWHASGA